MREALYTFGTYVFDELHGWWERPNVKRGVATLQVLAFVLGLALIEANRHGWLPNPLAQLTPLNHFFAIKLAFTLVLIQEVVDLVFILPESVSKAVAKQFEILCLILLRNAFKELVHLREPIILDAGIWITLAPMLTDALGALLIFVGLGLLLRLHKARKLRKEKFNLYTFVAKKKLTALLLLAVFMGGGLYELWLTVTGRPLIDVFATFYTALIFADILIVLLSQRHMPSFHAVFRNSGFALATLFIRLALAAPPYVDVLLGVAAMAFALGLTLAYNATIPPEELSPRGPTP